MGLTGDDGAKHEGDVEGPLCAVHRSSGQAQLRLSLALLQPCSLLFVLSVFVHYSARPGTKSPFSFSNQPIQEETTRGTLMHG